MNDIARGAAPIGRTTHFIGGRWSEPGGRTFPVHNPFDDKLVAEVAAGGRAEAEAAVEAAHRAFPAWAAAPPAQRQALFLRAAEITERRAEDIYRVLAVETGSSRAFSTLQVRWSAGLMRQAAAGAIFPTATCCAATCPAASPWSPANR